MATKFTSPCRGLEGKRLLFMVCDSRGRIVLYNVRVHDVKFCAMAPINGTVGTQVVSL